VKVVVVGAGLGGLAVAVRLAGQGHQVVVVEKRHQPGGRAGRLSIQGYEFDTGPTIVTAPSLLDDLWAGVGRRRSDDVELLPLDPFYRIAFPDGRAFDYSNTPELMDASLRRFDPEGPAQLRRFLAAIDPMYRRGFQDLGARPFLTAGDFIRVVPDLARLGALQSVYRFVSRFFRDEALRTVFSFHPLFIGGNPFRASAIYAMVPYLEWREGVSYVAGGTYALVRGLVNLIERHHGEIRTEAEVEQILIRNGRAAGVRLASGESILADAVVSNADVVHTYSDLVPAAARPRLLSLGMRRYRQSMSCFLLYLGLNRPFPSLPHHLILMPRRYRQTVESIFAARGLPEELALYIHTPTRTDPTLAPPGGETMYVLAPMPNLAAPVDWPTTAPSIRDGIVRALEDTVSLTGLAQSIVVERAFTPEDFARAYNSHLGAAFGIEPTLLQSAYFRPHNRSADVPGLYLVGAGTHPGAGIPGVLLSARIAADLIGRTDPAARRLAPAAISR
jgi:phytoene desaturase